MPYAVSNGVKIYYEVSGSGDPLVLVMGLGADNTAWAPHREEFDKHFTCISIDNRGAGKSETGGFKEFTTALMAEDVKAVMDHVGIEKAYLAGISMGGAISQMFAAKYPDRVRALALINTFHKNDNYMASVLGMFGDAYGYGNPLIFDRILQAFIYAHSTYINRPEVLKEREAGIDVDAGFAMTKEAFYAQAKACVTHDSTSVLGNISAPTLIVTGNEDILTPPYCSYAMLDAIPDSELFINQGGHVEHFEYVRVFNKVVTEFFLKH